MKFFLVSSDSGTPIYYDHKDGSLLTLPMVEYMKINPLFHFKNKKKNSFSISLFEIISFKSTIQNVFNENFHEPLYTMRCGKVIIVMKRVKKKFLPFKKINI